MGSKSIKKEANDDQLITFSLFSLLLRQNNPNRKKSRHVCPWLLLLSFVPLCHCRSCKDRKAMKPSQLQQISPSKIPSVHQVLWLQHPCFHQKMWVWTQISVGHRLWFNQIRCSLWGNMEHPRKKSLDLLIWWIYGWLSSWLTKSCATARRTSEKSSWQRRPGRQENDYKTVKSCSHRTES